MAKRRKLPLLGRLPWRRQQIDVYSDPSIARDNYTGVYRRGHIALLPSKDREMVADTLLHELMHGILSKSGAFDPIDRVTEEWIVRELTTGLIEAFGYDWILRPLPRLRKKFFGR